MKILKLPILTRLLAASAIAAGSLALNGDASYSQPVPGQRGFWCDTSSGTPVTMYQNAKGTREPWIVWQSDALAASGYTNVRRCQEVSGRLETYRRNRQLNYITVGRINRQPVICTASRVNGPCEGLIYTLKPDRDPVQTLNQFLAWRRGDAGVPSLYESTQVPYIDLTEKLGTETAEPSQVQPPTIRPVPQPVDGETEELREL